MLNQKKDRNTTLQQAFTRVGSELPPQAVDCEKEVLGCCIMIHNAREAIPFMEPKHFYLESHQIIFQALTELKEVSLVTITRHLQATGELARVGGAYYLTKLNNNFVSVARLEYYCRIVQQMWIKRQLIILGNSLVSSAYDQSTDCIELFDQATEQLQEIEELFEPGRGRVKIVSGKDNEMLDLELARKGQKFTGLTCGYARMDEFFRFKQESFVIINGHDNVGKTFAIVHLAVCVNQLHGWRWILCCMENTESRIRQDIIQSKTGKHVSHLTQDEFLSWYEWSLQNFLIIRIPEQPTADSILKLASKANVGFNASCFFLDPYSALTLPQTKDRHFNSHEYHYEVTSRMRSWIRKNKCSIYLSTHAVTEALRQKHKDGDYAGYPMPPQKADVEGGGKFANRADDFLTVHRYTNHPTENNATHIHVRKVKDTQTGGRPTIQDDPIVLKTIKGYFGLFDENGDSPIVKTKLHQYDSASLHDFTEPNRETDPPF